MMTLFYTQQHRPGLYTARMNTYKDKYIHILHTFTFAYLAKALKCDFLSFHF